MLETHVQNPANKEFGEEKQITPPNLNLTGRKRIMEESWGYAIERGNPYEPYHFNVYEDSDGSDECTAYISDPEGVSVIQFDHPEDAEDYCFELLGQPDWETAIREGKSGTKIYRVAWADIIK